MSCGDDAAAIVIGGGIAGLSAAWALAARSDVIVVEMAPTTGYHASGRSASVLSETSGHRLVCALAAASRGFFESPPPGFVDQPLLSARGLLWVGGEGQRDVLDAFARSAALVAPSVRRLEATEVLRLMPRFRPEAVTGGGVFEPDAMTIDADALLQGFGRGLRGRGSVVRTSEEALTLRRIDSKWVVTTERHALRAPVVVNAAGAWGDVVAERAGIPAIGLQPRRRTACIAALADVDPQWPLVMDISGAYYFEPASGGLLVSPADETPSEPCDARAEEVDVAIALDRVREATTLPVKSVRTAWAGLRTFSPDSAPVVGEEPSAPGFYWLVGQGGGGIKTAPALAAAIAAAVFDEPIPSALVERGVSAADLSPSRFVRKSTS
ncbi:MAG TPA: FAD-dependent oxidoreductase [Ilumatobacteraceae bacterium]|nr:FAD-dependent oxidoreductase [Ilumatobacteraceae bacterium]